MASLRNRLTKRPTQVDDMSSVGLLSLLHCFSWRLIVNYLHVLAGNDVLDCMSPALAHEEEPPIQTSVDLSGNRHHEQAGSVREVSDWRQLARVGEFFVKAQGFTAEALDDWFIKRILPREGGGGKP